jgi:hypothetical protein
VSRAALLAATLVLACGQTREREREPSESDRREAPTIERPRIEIAGCRARTGSTCTLAAGSTAKVQVWIDVQSRARVAVTIDGVAQPFEPSAADGGQRWTLALPADAERVEILGIDPRWTAIHTLELVHESIPAIVREASEQALAGDDELAIATLRAELDRLEGRDRLDALQLLRRLLGITNAETLRRTEEAAELALTLGRGLDFADCAAGAALIHMSVYGDLAAADRWIRRLEREAEGADEARVWTHYYRGVLASRSGDFGTALRSFDEARRGASRLAMNEEFLAASELLGPALAELGRGAEALAVAHDTLALARSPALGCSDRARALGNVAWAHLLLAEAELEHDAPAPLLDEQLGMVEEQGSCPDRETAAYARVNLALVALADDEPEEAWHWLGELSTRELPSTLQPWVDEIAAQVGLASGRWTLVPELIEQPDPGGAEPGLRFSALVRHARALERWGFDEVAITSYAAAEDVLEQALSGIGVELGRELFLAGRQASAVGLVDRLIAGGRVDEALCRARLARGRALRSLDRSAGIASLSDEQRADQQSLLVDYAELRDRVALERLDDWSFSTSEREHRESQRREQLAEAELLLDDALLGAGSTAPSCEALSRPATGEVVLVQFPSPAGQWLFIVDATGVTVTSTLAGADGLERALVEFEPRIAAAERLRVVPTGEGWALDFHALAFGSGVLLDVAPIAYSLDLVDDVDRGARAGQGDRRALVVADPSDDLPHARREAAVVSEQLRGQGWTVEQREGPDATRVAIADRLAAVELFHYAGHGVHGGTSGWGAALLLSEGDTLDVGDILALPSVPRGVVLTGCDTATVATDTLDGGMNLGRAFVLAGADWVLAAEGKVDDALALRVGESMVQGEVAPSTEHAAEALREIQLRLRRESRASDWAAFRVIVP